jgi:L-asparagine oxygenase
MASFEDLVDLSEALRTRGYAFIDEWRPASNTLEVAGSLGNVVDIASIMPSGRVSKVQTLVPRKPSEAPPNRYSGAFGFGPFPLHTDLAHWALPPRYFMLRCIQGSPSVLTTLLPRLAFEAIVGRTNLRRAIVRPRRAEPGRALCAIPLLFGNGNVTGVRWDPMFIVPMNEAAQRVAAAMQRESVDGTKTVQVALSRPGDTLVVDNWSCLHGRGSVPEVDRDRKLERLYFSTVVS